MATDTPRAIMAALTDREIQEVIRRTWAAPERVEVHRAALEVLAERHGPEVAEVIYWQIRRKMEGR